MHFFKHSPNEGGLGRVLSFSSLAITILVMVVATFVEKVTGSAADIYGSWWFAALWAVVAVSGVCYLFRRRMQRRPVLLVLHLAFVVILVGALVTHIAGRQGVLHLRMGDSATFFVDADGMRQDFPFAVTLRDFRVSCYPGTQTPMDFISEIEVDGAPMQISMNHIAEVQGYRLYQSAFDEDRQGTILAVSYDPWGIGITYVGYALLFLSMFLLLILPSEGFRRALRRLSAIAVLFFFMANAQAAPHVVPDSIARHMGELYCYYNGRICPLQTVAYDFTTKLYGKPSCNGASAEQVFASWLVYPTEWRAVPKKRAKDARTADEQAAIERMFLNGQFLKIFPCGGAWYSYVDRLPEGVDDASALFVKRSLDYVCELIITQQYDKVSYTLAKIRKFQREQAGDILPSDARFRAEQLYNTSNATRPLAMTFAILGILLFAFYLRFWLKGRPMPRWSVVVVNAVLALTLAYQLAFLGVRWYVSGHLPMTNGHETMQLLAVVVMSLTLAMQRRFVLVMPFGYLLTGLTLLVSMMGQSNPQITPLMPVLASPLLSLHVCIIMLAYALLAFTFLNGLTALFLRDERKVVQLQHVTQVLLYPALFCMAGGIFIGAIWANVSWGRYWGWDPKEVWALITLLVYCFAMHSRSLAWFRRPRNLHLFMVLAFLTVLMTYFGVNFLLGGMHSYANG